MKLTVNFSLNELTKSQTAERKGIDNTPSTEHQENLKRLCESILQRVRDHFGRVVSVSSGYRSEELCLAIGSKTTSQHAKGEAADFEIYGLSNKELAHTSSYHLLCKLSSIVFGCCLLNMSSAPSLNLDLILSSTRESIDRIPGFRECNLLILY